MSATAQTALPPLEPLEAHDTLDVLGSETVEAEAAIYFPEGLVGCPDWRRFVQVVDTDEELPVVILQSLDRPEVQLLVTNPRLIDEAYARSLSSVLQSEDGAQPVLFCTLTVGSDGSISANLMGPLVINPQTRRGRQVVLADSAYSTRYPVAAAQEAQD